MSSPFNATEWADSYASFTVSHVANATVFMVSEFSQGTQLDVVASKPDQGFPSSKSYAECSVTMGMAEVL